MVLSYKLRIAEPGQLVVSDWPCSFSRVDLASLGSHATVGHLKDSIVHTIGAWIGADA
jgi:hypothetical protein